MSISFYHRVGFCLLFSRYLQTSSDLVISEKKKIMCMGSFNSSAQCFNTQFDSSSGSLAFCLSNMFIPSSSVSSISFYFRNEIFYFVRCYLHKLMYFVFPQLILSGSKYLVLHIFHLNKALCILIL